MTDEHPVRVDRIKSGAVVAYKAVRHVFAVIAITALAGVALVSFVVGVMSVFEPIMGEKMAETLLLLLSFPFAYVLLYSHSAALAVIGGYYD